jgi:hypothetical protein
VERGEVIRTSVLLILETCTNNLSGTDGHRLRCHQFYTSSNYPPRPSIKSSKKCYQKWLLSLFQNKEDLARERYPMVSRSMNGTSSLPGLPTMSLTAPLRRITRSQEKLYAGSSRQQNKQANRRVEQGEGTPTAGASYHSLSQRGVYSPVALDQPARQVHQSKRCVSGWKLKTSLTRGCLEKPLPIWGIDMHGGKKPLTISPVGSLTAQR